MPHGMPFQCDINITVSELPAPLVLNRMKNSPLRKRLIIIFKKIAVPLLLCILSPMKKKNFPLLPFFEKLRTNETTQFELSRFIEYCFIKSEEICKNYFHQHPALMRIIPDFSNENFAIDTVARLFNGGERKCYDTISSAMKKWSNVLSSEDEASFFVSVLLSKLFRQELQTQLRIIDPFYGKILDSVNYLIAKHGLKKICFLTTSVIVSQECDSLPANLISNEDFALLPNNLFVDKKMLLPNMMTYFANETHWSQAIPLHPLIVRLKHLNFAGFMPETGHQHEAESFSAKEVVSGALDKSLKKLYQSYLEKGKLNEEECALMTSALKDISVDMLDGGIHPSLYDYLQKHDNELTKEKFQLKYHNIIEYLVKDLKTKISEEIFG